MNEVSFVRETGQIMDVARIAWSCGPVRTWWYAPVQRMRGSAPMPETGV